MFFNIYIEKVEAKVSEVSEVSSFGVSAETSEIYEISPFGLFDTKFGVVPFRRGCRFNCFGWDRGVSLGLVPGFGLQGWAPNQGALRLRNCSVGFVRFVRFVGVDPFFRRVRFRSRGGVGCRRG